MSPESTTDQTEMLIIIDQQDGTQKHVVLSASPQHPPHTGSMVERCEYDSEDRCDMKDRCEYDGGGALDDSGGAVEDRCEYKDRCEYDSSGAMKDNLCKCDDPLAFQEPPVNSTLLDTRTNGGNFLEIVI